MKFSIRLTHREKQLAESYAAQHSMSVGEAFNIAARKKSSILYEVGEG